MVFAGNTLPLGEVTDAQCTALAWVLMIGLDVMLGALNVKLYRIWRIFGNRRLVRVKVTEREMMGFLSLVVLIDALALVAWMVTHHPTTTDVQDEDYGVEMHITVCYARDTDILWVSFVLKVSPFP